MYRDPTTLDFLVVLFVVALVGYNIVRQRLSGEDDPIEAAKDAYAAGEIDHTELERRIEFHSDDRNEQIRAAIEPIKGVGPETSKAVADAFDSLAELHAADLDDLEAVHGVGESTAEAILDRLE